MDIKSRLYIFKTINIIIYTVLKFKEATFLKTKEELKEKEKPSIWKSYFKLIFKVKLPWFWIALVTALYVYSARLQFLFPGYAQKILGGDISRPVVFGAMAVIIGNTLMSAVIRVTSKFTNYKIDRKFRLLFWDKLLHSPIDLFDKEKPNELVSRITADTANVSMMFSYIIPSTIAMLSFTYTTIKELFKYDWRLGVGQLLYIPIYLVFSILYGRWQYKVNVESQNKLSKLTQYLSELLINIPLIKAFANEKKEDKRGKSIIHRFYTASLIKGIADWAEAPINGILSLIQTVIVLLSGVYLVSRDIISINQWIAYYLYVDMMYAVLASGIYNYIDIKRSQGTTARIAELLEVEEEEYIGSQTMEKDNRDINFNNVSFGYDKKQVLKDINLNIPYGKTTAIIGESGGGKTTMLSLILRFYKPIEGTITMGNTSIDDLNLDAWRGLFSYVSQDSPLLSGSVRDNIIYGVDREVSDEELIKVSRQANALEFINEFPNGFDSEVGEGGSKLSGGQRQRVSIARAMLRDSDILLLDEPTANLDNQAEKSIQEAMNNLLKGRTSIIIAHDLSTIKHADQIVLIDSGQINALGTHDELMESSALYRDIVESHIKGV